MTPSRSLPVPWFLAAALLVAAFGGAAPSAHATHCDSCVTVRDTCCTRIPHIDDAQGLPGFTAARGIVETREPDTFTPWPYSVTLYDITQNIPPENTNWSPITRYHGPGGSWNDVNLGTVFGLTLDKYGNIYVTHTSCYNSDLLGIGGAGAIYRLDGSTGAISVFATLPNSPDPNVPAGTNLPGLGNISYDCEHDQFFVTNMEDGRIYRIKSFNPNNASPAVVLNAHDPGMPDNGSPGWAPLGDRLWAVQWHANRVYYSVWGTDLCSPAGTNVIRSIGLDPSGDFMWFTDQPELTVPSHPSSPGISSPVSDISFGPSGAMLLAERTMCGPTTPSAHQSRVLEYVCEPVPGGGPWIPSSNVFKPGQIGTQDNAAGGVDYDYGVYDGPSPPASAPNGGLGGSQGRVWATSDAIHLGFPYADIIYGCQAFRPTHPLGSILNSLLVDSDGNITTTDKTFIGDVEVPCPEPPTNRICGTKFNDVNHDGVMDANESGLPGWTISITGPVNQTTTTDPAGNFCFTNLPAGTYTVCELTQPGWVQTAPPGGCYTVTVPPDAVNLLFGNARCVADPCVQPPPRMTAWYPLDEPAGTLSHDIVGSNHGTWQGSPVVISGMVSNALNFPTPNDYVAAPNSAAINFGTGNFSIDAWVRSAHTDNTVRVIVDHRGGTSSNPIGYSLFLYQGRLGFQLGDGSPTFNFIATPANVGDGQWHHVAVTVVRNSTTGGTLYVDGAVVHTFDPTIRPGNTNNAGGLWIGQRMLSGNTPFEGDVDEVELFRRALTTSEVQAIYNAGSRGKCKKSCWVPSVRTYGPNQTSITVCFTLTNRDWSQPMTYDWSLSGLAPSLPQCTVAGPTVFSPQSGTVTVPPGGTVPVCVTIQRPAGLTVGQVACYQLTVLNDKKGTCFTCTGKLRASGNWQFDGKPDGVMQIPTGGLAVSFTVTAGPAAKAFEHRIAALPYESDPGGTVVSLNGLPPGEPVIDTRSAGPNETFDVSVMARYLEHLEIPLEEIVLSADLDGDGVPDDACAVAVQADPSMTVGAETEPRTGPVEELLGYPNPFEASTGVRFALPKSESVRVRVFDVNGRMMRDLYSGTLGAGAHHVEWDGQDAQGKRADAGIYFIRVEMPGRVINAKVVRVN